MRPGFRISAYLLAFLSLCMPGGGARAASLNGLVVENATGRPLARTKVVLRGRNTAAAPRTQVLSGSGGEFSFFDLPAGIYFLRAERKGYATTKHGQTGFDEPGKPIVLADDGHFSAELRMKRLGVITGAVLDENQVGLEDVAVHAYRREKRWKAVASARTDDRGVYRLSGLRPGRYLVRSSATRLATAVSLLPTYYGQTAGAADARRIEVRLDQEVNGVDLTPAPGRLGHLTGSLAGGSARAVEMLTEVGPRSAIVKPGGRFDFGGVEPGHYTLTVPPAATGGQLAGFAEFIMSSADLHITVELKTAPRLSIACELDGGGGIDARTVSIFLQRKGSDESPVRVHCGDDSLWAPGEWQIGVAGPTQYYTKAILSAAGGEGAHEFRLTPGQDQQITILFGRDPGSLTGRVLVGNDPAIGAPVFLNTYDTELRSRLGGVRSTRADQDGRFYFSGLPPGRYEIVSSYQIKDPGLADLPAVAGTPVTVEKSKQVEQDVPLTVIR